LFFFNGIPVCLCVCARKKNTTSLFVSLTQFIVCVDDGDNWFRFWNEDY
jgi:hypothetical protein